jgi:hypothetical protein
LTTTNVAEARAFVGEAHKSIRVSPVDWDGLSSMLARMVRDVDWVLTEDDDRIGAGSGGTKGKVMLAPMIRALALKTSLAVLFEMKEDVDAEHCKHLVDLGNIIHETWMGMKRENKEEILEFKVNHILQGQLLAVFNVKQHHKGTGKGNIDINNPRSNPLNLILPSFETLWRIVLRLFLVLHDHDDRKEGYKQIFLDFVQNPTSTQFNLELSEELISAEYLVKEALRLYPPTRRIRRVFQFADSNSDNHVTVAAADVEACQLDTDVWGVDALQFKPARWRKVHSASGVENRDRNFLAFGARPFLCPASRDFSPMVIALLVGILLEGFPSGDGGDCDGSKWVLGSNDAADMEGVYLGARLRNERGGYEGVFLEWAP